jgi:hypothetical protein
MQLRLAIASLVLAMSAGSVQAEQEPARKDAAEAVGEGNTSRWLDYYRRERGQDWSAPPATEKQTPARAGNDAPQPQPAADPAESRPNRP